MKVRGDEEVIIESNKTSLTDEEIEDLFDRDPIQSNIVDQRRWVTVFEDVYAVGSNYVMIQYEQGSTECQDYDVRARVWYVQPKEVTKTEYVKCSP